LELSGLTSSGWEFAFRFEQTLRAGGPRPQDCEAGNPKLQTPNSKLPRAARRIIDVTARGGLIAQAHPMKRRDFIGMAAVGAAGVVAPGATANETSLARVLAQPRLLDVFHDKRFVRAIGRSYLEQLPAENDAAFLVREIAGQALDSEFARTGSREAFATDTPRHSHPGAAGDTAVRLRAKIEEQVRRDFDEGRTVLVDGWILARTEARQCALCALLS
jgi:hypothetical protein